MAERFRRDNEGFLEEVEAKKEKVGNQEITELEHSPWQDLTDDLAVLAHPEKANEPNAQVFINNEDAMNAVREGWLVVEENSKGGFRAYTTVKWHDEKTKRKDLETKAKVEQVQIKNGAKNGKNGNSKEGSDIKRQKSALIDVLKENRMDGFYELTGTGDFYELIIYREKDSKNKSFHDGKKIKRTERDNFKGSLGQILVEFVERYAKNN